MRKPKMKTLFAAVLGLVACADSASAYSYTPFGRSNSQIGLQDVWRFYRLVSLSLPAPISQQWISQRPAWTYFSAPASSASASPGGSSVNGSGTINTLSIVPVSGSLESDGAEIPELPVIANASVADGGSTLILLAGALGTLGWFQRRGRGQV